MLRQVLLITLGLLAGLPASAQELLEPEQAFKLSVQSTAPQSVEVRFAIADGYYLYKDKFKFAAEPANAELGPAQLPPGKVKQDEFFGQVEIYRTDVKIHLPVTPPEGVKDLRIKVTSQGCADIGICYPPNTQIGDVVLSAATAGAAAPARSASAASASSDDESSQVAQLLRTASFWFVIASFFGFGLLLTFTPCVLPMVPILSGIIVGHGHHISKARALGLSLAYVFGMAATYAVAGVAAGLSGTLLSAALQNPWVLGAFAAIFVLLALSMFGFYEMQLPTTVQSRLSDSAGRQKGGSLAGVSVMGALSGLIVGPCVAAPLAGALLYIAQSGDAVLGGAALFFMALGMGVPLIVVGVSAHTLLPRVGPWMEGVKRFFGVALLAVAIWIVSPVVPAVAAMLAWAALLILSAMYLHALDPLPPQAHGWRRFLKGVGVVALLVGASLLIGALAGSRDPLQPLAVLRGAVAAGESTLAFERVRGSKELDARLKSAGKPVMLDFYADWCVSCKEMERFTFSDARVQAALKDVLLLRIDVTENTEEDKQILKRFGLFGPPGIIFFDRRGREIQGSRVIGYQNADRFAETVERALHSPIVASAAPR